MYAFLITKSMYVGFFVSVFICVKTCVCNSFLLFLPFRETKGESLFQLHNPQTCQSKVSKLNVNLSPFLYFMTVTCIMSRELHQEFNKIMSQLLEIASFSTNWSYLVPVMSLSGIPNPVWPQSGLETPPIPVWGNQPNINPISTADYGGVRLGASWEY